MGLITTSTAVLAVNLCSL